MTTTEHTPRVQAIIDAAALPPPDLPVPGTAEWQTLDLLERLLHFTKCVADGCVFTPDEASMARETLADPYFAKARAWHARHNAAYRDGTYDTEPITDAEVATLDSLGLAL